MLDTNRMPKDVALEYLEEKIDDRKKLLEANNEIRRLAKEAIKDKQIIIKILQICTENECNLANQIIALVKNARKEES